ncbi:Gfo/Idh/MocA family protein [Rhizobium sp. SSA_523]|uniref:Gfo/Idh/MocA family protein n=1 Tax=Rhizobium sp. SSA_523 TaxID=2952477 RepID=UPI002090C3CB|nr:Gfo/Idh/MocA family oxidoreductase [Rhizobium sp. SSA_523]MCO5732325.1 Gfo/Idh/MocA family oxidoreductase [Rhizobium sp. SSA_523]WKC21273.1 Gfo/Idh/MocA family oxidoreductase [Rhizobium sp. SSA_523]
MKVAIIGLGFRLGYLGHIFRQIDPAFEIVGYVDPAPAGLERLTEAGISPGRSYATPEALIAGEEFDLLMIGSPNHLHLEHIRIGLEAGLTVFTEKPIVVSIEESLALASLLHTFGHDRLLVGLVLRYSPLYRDLREAQANGMLGEIASIEASEHIAPYHGAFFMRDWRRYSRYAGGFMLEKCCHDLDLYNGVMGSRPRFVASFGGRKSFVPGNAPSQSGVNDLEVYHRKPSGWMGADKVFDSDGDIIDFQTAIVEYESGASMTFHTNLNVPDEFRRFCVIGSKGMAEGDFVRGFLDVHDAHTSEKRLANTYQAPSTTSHHYGADEQMAADVLAHITTGAALPVSALDAIEAGILALAMDEARQSRKVVDLAPVWHRYDACLHGENDAAQAKSA